MKKLYEIDGAAFQDLDGFFDIVSNTLIPNAYWGKNLDAFNDILRGGFGTPEEGFIILWKNSSLSKEKLGHTETIKWLKQTLETCHPSNKKHVKERIINAENRVGLTLFDILIEIIKDHGVDGTQPNDQVELRLF